MWGKLPESLLALLCAAALASCTVPETLRESAADCASPGASIVFVIEGDGHMTYHDASGSEHDAAQEKTDEAVALAEQLHDGEVFILRSGARPLFLFPSGSGDLLHYCRGREVGRGSFSRDSNRSDFEIAAQMTAEAARGPDVRRVLVYYGHALAGEDAPRDGMTEVNEHATVSGLAHALASMTHRGGTVDTLDLVILSACQSATPAILRAVAPFTRCLIASPADLHLSHIDTDALSLLDSHPGIPVLTLADSIASLAFRRLMGRTRTEITIARYDQNALQMARDLQAGAASSALPKGAHLWLRPAEFGKKSPTRESRLPGPKAGQNAAHS